MRLLLRGGTIHAPAAPGAGAMLVVDDIVAWVGPDSGADVHRDSADAVVDLEGALVAPAFVDAHVHHTATGLTLLGLDLRGVASRAALLERVSAQARAGRGRPIVGHGWDETLWSDQRLPTRQELDRASWGSVVYLSRIDVHSAIVSSAMVALVPGVAGVRGFEDSGRVTAHAHHLVRAHVTQELPGGLREAAQRATREHAAAAGVAALHEAAGPDINGAEDLRALQELAATTVGPELVAYWGQAGGPDAARALGALGAAGDLFVDGALGSHTALLRQPYIDAPELTGNQYLDADAVAEHLVACTEAGMQAGFHAIGDAAIDVVTAALEVAEDRCGQAAVRAARHRVEHLSMVSPAHADVLARVGAIASVQPLFDALWGGPGGAYLARLGAHRAADLHDFAGLVRAGVSLAFGSDSPVTAIEPWEWVRAAMHHQHPKARISGRAAFAAATRGGWRAAGRD
ncbi:MAG: amidohydrolase family protein, partial [Candidatus Nanopelagicales bacterium]